jgi:imidazolonepropionase-like amidohydrolase
MKILLKNGLLYTMSGTQPVENGSILVENSKILKVGIDLDDAADKVINLNGAWVFPGLIDAHCHAGIFEAGMGVEGSDGNECTDPITPELRGIDGINPQCESFEDGFRAGVTTVATGPGSANTVGGQFAALKTYGKTIKDKLVKEPLAMKCAFGENPKRVYGGKGKKPETRMANAALLRELLGKTVEYCEKQDLAEEKKDISLKPSYDAKLEAMSLVIRKQIPLKAHAHRADDMLTALRIAEEFDVDITLEHCTEAHLIVEELVESGRGLIIGPSFMFKGKPEVRHLSLETPGILANAGAKVAIMTDLPCAPLSFLRVCVGLAVQSGMPWIDGCKSVTINAAEILGLNERIGSLEPGKDADIAVYDKEPFTDLTSHCLLTMINGEIVYSDKSFIV